MGGGGGGTFQSRDGSRPALCGASVSGLNQLKVLFLLSDALMLAEIA